MSFFGKLRLIDLYKKVPHDLTEGTYGGAILSITCTVIIVVLFISSLVEYLSSVPTSQMLIDDIPAETQLPVYFRLQFTKVPCSMVFADNQDILGFAVEGVQENIIKRPIIGGMVQKEPVLRKESSYTFDEVKQQMLRGEGCEVEGKMTINRVPGNIHFSVHNEDTSKIAQRLSSEHMFLNYAHKIEHFTFGSHDHDVRTIQKKFPEIELFPLEGSEMDENIKLGIAYQYYLNIVRTKINLGGAEKEVYQYTISKSYGITRDLPALFFKYEVSPLYVRYGLKSTSIWYFIVNICAIIGGVYTAFSILDAVIYTSVSRIFKNRIGKLSQLILDPYFFHSILV